MVDCGIPSASLIWLMLSGPRRRKQFQDAHANRGSEPPDDFELLLGIDVEKAANAFCL